ncbi:MAG: RNA-directed DNA polymerase, partial [Desulfobacterales bacterium]|nr:RNA-directed DNA polymerase [Desulfobacterales bacterium]
MLTFEPSALYFLQKKRFLCQEKHKTSNFFVASIFSTFLSVFNREKPKMSSIGPPEPFLPFPGEPIVPWNLWKFEWKTYVQLRTIQIKRLNFRTNAKGEAVPADQHSDLDYSNEEQNMELIHCLGSEGRRLFSGTQDYQNMSRDPADVIKICDGIFHSEINSLVALKPFRSRRQLKEESAKDFAAELRILSIDCDFTPSENATKAQNKEIAQQLVLNCNNESLQQKLFAEFKNHQCDLDKVLGIMTAHEESRKNVQSLKSGQSGASMAPFQNCSQQNNQRNFKNMSKSNKNPSDSAPAAHPQTYCYGCGKKGHKHGDKQHCKAFGKTCPFCNIKNHFESVCNKKKQGQQLKQDTVVIIGSNRKSDDRIFCKLTLHPIHSRSCKSASFKFLADSGAEAASLHQSEYNRFLSHVPLTPTTDSFSNFDGSPGKTKPIGIINVRATFKRRSAELPLYIVDDSCLQVIGLNQMSLLGMQINTATKSISSSHVNYNLPSAKGLLSELTSKHSRLFSDGIGLIPNVSHRIQLKPDARPVKMKERQVPFAMQDSGKRALDKLLEAGVIKKADKSEWVHPLHLVGKPDGDARPTVDFSRGINKWVVPSIHPLPCAKDIFQKIGNFKFFSKLDISSAYHHIALDADSQPLTTFISPWHGLLMYNRVPMGLTDSGDAFQKAIDSTLSGLQGVFAYADDVLIGGSTREEHDSRLREVIQRLDENNFRLKKPKLVIAQQKVTMLGHLISASDSQTTICPDPKNVESILKLPVPKDIHGIRQFLGACQFFSDF